MKNLYNCNGFNLTREEFETLTRSTAISFVDLVKKQTGIDVSGSNVAEVCSRWLWVREFYPARIQEHPNLKALEGPELLSRSLEERGILDRAVEVLKNMQEALPGPVELLR